MGAQVDERQSRDFKQMHLAIADVVGLLIAYLILLLIGLGVVIRALVEHAQTAPNAGLAILYCAAMSLVGSGIFYVRKLYKAMINESYTLIQESWAEQSSQTKLKRLGTLAFFLFRPIFGVAFSVLVYSLWRLSLSASGTNEVQPTLGFLYTTISLGFVSGFLAGRMLGMLESYSQKRLGGILGADT